jgi:hypothetical protein
MTELQFSCCSAVAFLTCHGTGQTLQWQQRNMQRHETQTYDFSKLAALLQEHCARRFP